MAEVFTHNCGAEWTGLGRCHCSKCHVTFGGITSFDQHRKGKRCLEPSSMGLTDNGKDVWVSDYTGPHGD